MKYAYYISCINVSMTKELDSSLDILLKELEIEFIKLKEGLCCGGSNLDFVNPDHFLYVNGRNIALAEKLGLDLVTSCNTCLLGLRHCKHILDSNQEKKDRVNEALKKEALEYKGTSEVKHLLWVINEDYGLDKIRKKVTQPLNDYSIAPFYGCHILRPSHLLGKDDPDSPSSLHQLIEALGGKVSNYASQNRCCGFHTLLVAEKESISLAGKVLADTIEADADFIVTPCPLCHTMLDSYQHKALKKAKRSQRIQVIHLSQLISLSLGYSKKELGMNKHVVNKNSKYSKAV